MSKHNGGWIGVDLDGTLAHYDGFRGIEHIGQPIEPMLRRVRSWIEQGIEVRIFTARVGNTKDDRNVEEVRKHIEDWCLKFVGKILTVTNLKDFGMWQLWDDRAVQVIPNTGIALEEVISDASDCLANAARRI